MRYLSFICLTLLLCSCQDQASSEQSSNQQIQIDTHTINRHIVELADDRYMGRMPFTEGERLTLDYLEKEFKALGLEPGNGDSYRQEVPMVEITGYPDTVIQMSGTAAKIDWQVREDYVLFTDQTEEVIKVENSELVFCGYGIVAPEYGWNDYEGINMQGKTAVVMVNDPGYQGLDSTIFKGNSMTYYGRWTYKYEEAARQGAAAVLIIHETGAAGYPWFVVESSWTGSRLTLAENNMPKSPINGWITLQAARELFLASGVKGGPWFERAQTKGFKPVPLNMQLTTSLRNKLRLDKSYNIVARLPGQERPDEHIIYTAHWDHIGTGPSVDGDTIYNGALDNASGTASLLAIAEAYTKLPEVPARSVVFLSVTAEEQGLFGSAHYVAAPLFPLNQAVANINMDGVNPSGAANDLTITGFGHSQMDELAEEIASQQGRYIQPGQEPEKGYFFRSDHFNFAKAGVPALYAKGGYDHRQFGKEYAQEQKDDYTKNRYHRPADEYHSGDWDLGGVLQDGQLYFELGLKLANSNQWPLWRADSEFFRERKQ